MRILENYLLRFSFSLFCLLLPIIFIECSDESEKTPSVQIDSVGTLTESVTLFVRAKVIMDGGAEVTSKGFCWDVQPEPTIELETKTSDDSSSREFSVTLTDLSRGDKYYIRPYATNSAGTAYGEQIEVEIPDNKNIDFFPLALGNEWVYASRKANSQYEYPNQQLSYLGKTKITIVNVFSEGGETYYQFKRITTYSKLEVWNSNTSEWVIKETTPETYTTGCVLRMNKKNAVAYSIKDIPLLNFSSLQEGTHGHFLYNFGVNEKLEHSQLDERYVDFVVLKTEDKEVLGRLTSVKTYRERYWSSPVYKLSFARGIGLIYWNDLGGSIHFSNELVGYKIGDKTVGDLSFPE